MSKPLPELRASIIGGILRHVAETPDAVSYSALFGRALAETGMREEEVGADIMHATSHLILSGLLASNTHDVALGQVYFAAGMTVVVGHRLLGFIWDETLPSSEDVDGEEA
ncbi:hypothetical protein [uncultured Bosea sp.]|uniref:hypothetical protein n=1 Tax=uncultured Bosea sp. TaxID=211457 RepID=UPI0025CCFFE6|nr:hypothetical protein [uncultured Bosea sp.]